MSGTSGSTGGGGVTGADAAALGAVLPPHTVLAAILRDYRPITPDGDERFERGDELIFLTAREGETALAEIPEVFSTATTS